MGEGPETGKEFSRMSRHYFVVGVLSSQRSEFT